MITHLGQNYFMTTNKKYNIVTSICKTVFPEGNSLPCHIEAVHEPLKQKNIIANISSLRFHKVNLFISTALRK